MVNFLKALADIFGPWKTPSSGQKRRREESDNVPDQRLRKVSAPSPTRNVTALDMTDAAKPLLASESAQAFSSDLGLSFASPAAPSTTAFSLGGRVRELTPRNKDGLQGRSALSSVPDVKQPAPSQGDVGAAQAEPFVGHPQRDLAGPNAAAAVNAALAPNNCHVGRAQPVVRSQEQLPQQASLQVLAGPSGQARPGSGAPPPSGYHSERVAPEPRHGYGATPSTSQLAIPRQLFNTPNSTLQRFRGMTLGNDGTQRPLPAAMQPEMGTDSNGRTAAAVNGPFTAPRAAGYGSLPSYEAAGSHLAYPGGVGVNQAWQPQRPSPLAQSHPQQPVSRGPGLPFSQNYLILSGHLARPAPKMTDQHLRELLALYEASARSRPAVVAPTREDGGYVPGDAEDPDDMGTAAKASDARATLEQLRSALKKVTRTASAASNPRAVQAASDGAAARASLAVSQAVAGPETLAAVERKMAVHEQEVKKLRREAEESTRQQLAAVKTNADAYRSQREQQNRLQSERLQQVAQPPPQTQLAAKQQQQQQSSRQQVAQAAPSRQHGAAAAAAAPGPCARGAARQQAGKAAKPPPPDDDDVVDLISSDEEDEAEAEVEEGLDEQEGQYEDEEAWEDGGEDEAQYGQYGGPFGSYGNEAHGGGNRALARATAAERATWRRTMDTRAAPGEVLLSFRPNPATSIELPREKLVCMEVGTWLNDEVINLYMMLLQARDQRMRSRPFPRCHFFNSFFYNKLFVDEGRYNYANVRRWTMARKLKTSMQDSPNVLELDRIIIPIHKGVHWTCAEIDLKAKAVRYYDSLKGEDAMLAKNLKAWVQDEAQDKLQQRWDTSTWRVEFPKNIPEQTNGCDCGVFSIMFADCLGAGRPLAFHQSDMNLLRARVLNRLIELKVD